VTDRLIKITTAVAVIAVAAVAATVSYAHVLELTRSHGENDLTARLIPFTVDGLIWAASMVILDAGRRAAPAPPLAKASLAAGITAAIGANVAHGAPDGPIRALVSAWPALALIGSFELLMTLVRSAADRPTPPPDASSTAPEHAGPLRATLAPTLEQIVLAEYQASLNGPGRPLSQRHLAEKHGIDRRKVKHIIAGAEALDS
jgi:hypothetical protein